MKKINYMAPEMEVITLNSDRCMLDLISNSGGDPNVYDETPDPGTIHI